MRRAALLAAALVALVPAAAARADGDPASDVLLAQDAYYPYAPKVSPPLSKALDALLADVRKKGYPMKVALIQTPADLGAYPNLFGQTQKYADLLAKEISFNARPHLLIVMPTGFGGDNLGAKVDEALSGIEVDQGAQSDGLVEAALEAVAKIATANGHATPVPAAAAAKSSSGGSSGRSTPSVIVYGGPVLLVGLAVAILLFTSRRRREDDEEEPQAAVAKK